MTSSSLTLLVLGGTAWLGREICRQGVERGHAVSCLARGASGEPEDGVSFIRADRVLDAGYDEARRHRWDAVIEVSWQPRMVREALAALSDRAQHWIYVSSGSVYASHAEPGGDERAELLTPTAADAPGIEHYGAAKVACELASLGRRGPELLIARSGLIGGPGDRSDRAGYWVARAARDPLTAMLVPDALSSPVQVVDVRDLASWLLHAAEQAVVGIYDAVGPRSTLEEWIETSRQIGGHTGPVVRAAPDWLRANGVQEFMGNDSLPLWISDPEWRGFSARSGVRAVGAGLGYRSVSDTIRNTLGWERELGLSRERRAGITAERERDLVAKLASA